MPLDLHPDGRETLVNALAEELEKVEVQNNSFLVARSTVGFRRLDAILPNATSKIGQKIGDILGDEPASDFVYDQLSIRLRDRPFSSDTATVRLTSIEGFEDSGETAEQLVSEFVSLPWSYSLFTNIPYDISQRLRSAIPDLTYPLNDTFRLVRFDETDTEYPPWPNGRLSLFKIESENRFQPELFYLNGVFSGYVGLYLSLRPVVDFQLVTQAFFGLGFAERVFKPRYYHFSGDRKSSTVVFRREEESWAALDPYEFDSPTANLLHSVGPDSLIAKQDDQSRYWAKDFLVRARAAFSDEIVSDRLLGSAQWLFESYSGTNTLLSFVQAMVALEILFGDKAATDLVGLGELLANRCAYSIAKTREQREKTLSDFKRIYDTRSKIVHRGHSRLSRREENDLSTLRWMVARALQEEIKLSIGHDEPVGSI